jgi:hypothetical protein
MLVLLVCVEWKIDPSLAQQWEMTTMSYSLANANSVRDVIGDVSHQRNPQQNVNKSARTCTVIRRMASPVLAAYTTVYVPGAGTALNVNVSSAFVTCIACIATAVARIGPTLCRIH